MKRIFVDTGAWYALVDRKDPDHHETLKVFETYQGWLTTSNFVFDETITLLRYRLNWGVAYQFGENLLSGDLAVIHPIKQVDELKAWDIFKKYQDKSFSFTDCTSFALMERLKLNQAIAIDSDFKVYGIPCLPD